MSDKILPFFMDSAVKTEIIYNDMGAGHIEYVKAYMKKWLASNLNDTFISYRDADPGEDLIDEFIITIEGAIINKKTFIELTQFLSRVLSKEDYDKFRERFL